MRASVGSRMPTGRAPTVRRCAMQTLTGSQANALSEALRRAFTPARLDELLTYSLEQSREDITLAEDYQARVFQVLRAADAEGWVLDLLVAARNARPRHTGLQAVASDLGLGAAPGLLERLVRENVPFIDVALWRERLGVLEGQV